MADSKPAAEPRKAGYIVVSTGRGREHHSFDDLNARTRFVHIDGLPRLWAFRIILEKAPRVRVIQITPCMLLKLRSQSRFCAEQGIKVVTGYHRPALAWKGGDARSSSYSRQKQFFTTLTNEQKKAFEELLRLGIVPARITARYYCLSGEKYVPQVELAGLFGKKSVFNLVSRHVHAVAYFLDPTHATNNRSKRLARTMRRQLLRLRARHAREQERAKLVARLGIPYLPEKIPPALISRYAALLKMFKNGKLDRLALDDKNGYRAIVLRYGLDELNAPEFRTLRAVAPLMRVSHEMVRQHEERALRKLKLLR